MNSKRLWRIWWETRDTLVVSLYVPKLPAAMPEWLLLPPGLQLPFEKNQNRGFGDGPVKLSANLAGEFL